MTMEFAPPSGFPAPEEILVEQMADDLTVKANQDGEESDETPTSRHG